MLADKYDTAFVRGHCCQFLIHHVSDPDVDLEQPLDAPRNVLRAASLVCMYGSSSKAEELAPYRRAMATAVEGALSKLVAGKASHCPTCFRVQDRAGGSYSAPCKSCHAYVTTKQGVRLPQLQAPGPAAGAAQGPAVRHTRLQRGPGGLGPR